MFQSKQWLVLVLSLMVLVVLSAAVSCGRRPGGEDPAGDLAAVAGSMARDNDLKRVLLEDLNADGTREVILVYGPRELLDFDVYYLAGERWVKTPMVNDKGNPREFKGARLDSIRNIDLDIQCEIRVSSMLYDGNRMVKELRWSPEGYKVVSQSTMPGKDRISPPPVKRKSTARTSSQTPAAPEVKPAPEPEKKPKPVRPLRPKKGIYLVRKGDTVYGLARLFGVPAGELEKLNSNQLAGRGLRINQRINVPVPGRRNKNFTVRIDREDYKVQSGDALSTIARKHGVTVAELKSWNSRLPGDGRIKVGQNLKIHIAVVDRK
ncbi:MAG: LysM peptidoglycan-binding domain-containing protein [Gemmatimonadota bacterium]|nr:LysM peptidoglycan-binding domain-containing protein [Gemmatimonadota bacterium]